MRNPMPSRKAAIFLLTVAKPVGEGVPAPASTLFASVFAPVSDPFCPKGASAIGASAPFGVRTAPAPRPSENRAGSCHASGRRSKDTGGTGMERVPSAPRRPEENKTLGVRSPEVLSPGVLPPGIPAPEGFSLYVPVSRPRAVGSNPWGEKAVPPYPGGRT